MPEAGSSTLLVYHHCHRGASEAPHKIYVNANFSKKRDTRISTNLNPLIVWWAVLDRHSKTTKTHHFQEVDNFIECYNRQPEKL
jgi:hypothetical protein